MTGPNKEQQEFTTRIIEQVKSEPDFLGHLLEYPERALQDAGIPIPESLEVEPADIQGHLAYKSAFLCTGGSQYGTAYCSSGAYASKYCWGQVTWKRR